MERVLKNADISVLNNFLAIFFEFCSLYREILPSTIYMPNFRSIGPFKQKLQGEDAESDLPGHANLQFRVKNKIHCCQILARQEEIPQKTSKNISRYFCSSFQGHV